MNYGFAVMIKWKMMSTTTGTFINAGHYKVLLSAENMDGIAFDALDIPVSYTHLYISEE